LTSHLNIGMPENKETIVDLEIDQEGLSKLYDVYAPVLMGIIMRIIEDRTIAEKILYNAFLKIWETKNTYNPGRERIFFWMNRIARELAIEEITYVEYSGKNEANDLKKLIFSKEVRDYISGKILKEEIDEVEKNALRLMFIHYYTIEEVAKQLDIPIEILKAKIMIALNLITRGK